MTSYRSLELALSIAHPGYQSRAEKKTFFVAGPDLTIERDGDVVTITHSSGRTIETPWANVRYGDRVVVKVKKSA